MADKAKRLRKILVKKCLKGKLKPVGSLEETHLIIVENRQCVNKTMLIGRDSYREMVENGHTFPEEDIHYLVSTNPRNAWHVEQQFMSNSFGTMRSVLK